MKYCTHCGAELPDDAAFCTKCGCPTESQQAPYQNTSFQISDNTRSTLLLIAYIFSLIVTITTGLVLIPLLWTIPMTLYINDLRKGIKEHSLIMDVCIIIFNNAISGILLIVDGVTSNKY